MIKARDGFADKNTSQKAMDLSAQFKSYLEGQKKPASQVTIKNYIADLNQFIRWYESFYSQSFHPSLLTPDVIDAYKRAHASAIAVRSLERHLSTLRKFASFLNDRGYITHDPFAPLVKVAADPFLLRDFRNHLFTAKASDLTIKNYINDVKQFADWIARTSTLTAQLELSSLVTAETLKEYKARLIAESGLSPVSVNRKLSSLRKYLSWAHQKGMLAAVHSVENINLIPDQQPETSIANQAQIAENVASGNEDLQPENVDVVLPEQHEVTSKKARTYSKFPPLRLAQKFGALATLGFDVTIVALSAVIVEKLHYLTWIATGKQIFTESAKKGLGFSSKLKSLSQGATDATASNLSSLLSGNLKKEFYAPSKVSVAHLPAHKKAWHHMRHTRPEWYKKYHSYPVVHYFHFAALVIMMSALGFGLYRSFVESPQQNKTLAAAPTAPPRVMSFQGRLTDSTDTPIASAKDLRFAIYNSQSSSGSALLWQETQVVSPDQDGIFSVLLGSSTSIPASVFTDNSTLYLGVTVQSDPELSPRQQIATVAFAANSETLQGLFPITAGGAGTTNVVLALDSGGDLTIGGSASPTFEATGGSFTLSGSVLNLQTLAGSNTNINITPDGQGLVNISKPIVNLSNDNKIATAKGAVEINDLFAILATSSGQSAFTLDQNSTGPIISASASGSQRFTLANDGSGTFAGDVAVNGGDITASTSTLSINSNGASAGQLLLADTDTIAIGGHAGAAYNAISNSGGAPTNPNVTADNDLYVQGDLDIGGTIYVNGSQLSSGALVNYWQKNNGAISQASLTDDLLLGATSTASAKFGFINVGSGTPTATISSNFSIQVPTGASPAVTVNALKGGTLNFQTATAGQGDAGLASRLFITNAGNVGIGSTAPTAKLDVNGGIMTSTTGICFSSCGVQLSRSSNDLLLNLTNAASIRFATSNTERARFDANGNLGIGSTTPAYKLDVNGSTNTTSLYLNGSQVTSTATELNYLDGTTVTAGGIIYGNGTYLDNTGAGTSGYILKSNGSSAPAWVDPASIGLVNYWQRNSGTVAPLNITDDLLLGGTATSSALIRLGGTTNANSFFNTGGNLGIGTTNPASLFQVGSFGSSATVSASIVANAAVNTELKFREQDDTFGASLLYEATDNQFQIRTFNGDSQGSSALALARSSGNIAIGTTTTSTFKLRVAGSVGPDADDTYDLGSSARRWRDLYLGPASLHIGTDLNEAVISYNTTSNFMGINPSGDGSPEVTIDDNGNLGIGTTTASSYPLYVNGNGYINGNFTITGNLIAGSTGTSGFIQRNAGALSPANITDDLLLGATATSSATFGFINVAAGTPTATISSNFSLQVPTGASPAVTLNALKGGSLNFQTATAGQGDAGLTSRLFIKNDGNIGIGSTAPAFKLDTVGSARFGAASNLTTYRATNGIILGSTSLTDTVGLSFEVQDGTQNSRAGITVDATNKLFSFNNTYASAGALSYDFATAGTSLLRINTSGNVGIGSTTPGTKLDVVGGGKFTLGAAQKLQIDASTTDSTLTTGVIDVDVDTAADTSEIMNFTFTNVNDTAADTITGFYVKNNYTDPLDTVYVSNLEFSAATSPVAAAYVMQLTNVNTTNNVHPTAFLNINETENSGTAADGIFFNVGTGTTMTDAIDASDAQIDNALNLGQNNLLFSTLRLNEGTSGRIDIEDTSSNKFLTILDTGTTGNIGIGSTAPAYNLDVNGSTNTTSLYLNASQVTSTATELNYLDGTTVTAGGVIYGDGTKLANTGAGTSGYILSSNGSSAPSWTDPASLGLTNFWQRNLGALAPANITDDLLLGGTATASATVRLGAITNADSFFNTGGNVSIGTTTSGSKLGVNGGVSIGSTYVGTAAPTGGLLVSGNVGIGTTSFVGNASSKVVALPADSIISGGGPTTNLSAVQFTANASTTAGYGVYTNFNAYWDGTNFRQPRGTLPSYLTTANNHKGWSWMYAAAGSSDDGTVTPTEVAKIDSSGNFSLANGADIRPLSDSTNALSFATSAGTDILTIDSTNSRIGIGSTTPTAPLDVAGNIYAGGSRPITINPSGGNITIKGATGGWSMGYNVQGSSGTNYGGYGFYGTADTLNYYWIGSAYNTASVVVLPGGNVGIGSTAPANLLDVAGTGRFSGTLTANGALTANGTFTLGDNGDTGSINTSDWDISTTGALTGISGITTDGGYTQTGSSTNTFSGNSTFSGNVSVTGRLTATDPSNQVVLGTADGYSQQWAVGQNSRNQMIFKDKDSNTTFTGTGGTISITNLSKTVDGDEGTYANFTVTSTSDTAIAEISNSTNYLNGSVYSQAAWWPSVTFRYSTIYARSITVEARYDGDGGSYQTVWSTTTNTSPFWQGSVTVPSGIISPYKISALRITMTDWTTTGAVYIPTIGLHHRSEQIFPQYANRLGTTFYGTVNFSGVASDITTDTGEHLALSPGGNVGIGTTLPTTFKLQVTGNVGPSTDSTYNLGSNAVRWANGYFDTLYGDGSNLTGVVASSMPFSGITSGTNTSAAMVVGAGASLDYTSTGTINASSLAGSAESAFFKLADNETVTGTPAFNGGTTGVSAPFTVDSTYLVTNLNADLFDGVNSDAFLRSDTSDNFTSGTLTTDAGTTLDVNGDIAIADTNIAFDGATTTFTTTGAFTLTPGGNVILGDGGDTMQIDTSNWDISSAGVASGLTGLTSSGTITFSGLTASRAVFTTTGGQLTSSGASSDLASSLTDETGSGVAVFGTSPAITTSLTTGSTSFDLINTTATTVNFAGAATSLTIGATTGTATIRNATTALSGDLTIAGTTGITGSGAGAGLNFSGTGTHTIQGSAGTLQINAFTLGGAVTGNSQNITGLGNLTLADTKTIAAGGISSAAYQAISNSGGTPTNPNVTADNDLYVQGDLDIGGTLYVGGNQLANYWTRTAGSLSPANLNDTISATTSASTALTITQTGAFDVVRFEDQASDTTPFVINQDGNVGIGTTAPVGLLNVRGAITGKALVNINETGDQNLLTASASGTTRFSIANSGATSIIGNDSTEFLGLTIKNNAAISNQLATLSFSHGGNNTTNFAAIKSKQYAGASDGDLTFWTLDAGTLAQKMIITDVGNVGIGTTLPGQELDVNGDILVAGGGTIDARATGTLTIGGTTQTGLTLGRSGTTTAINSSSWSISGTGVAAGLTGLTSSGTITFSGLTASRAVFTTTGGQLTSSGASSDLASSLTDETGSGVAVFGTSPAITTSLTTGSTSFDLINTTATTVNFAGAATTLNIGASSGTATIANATTALSGNLTIAGTTGITASGVGAGLNFSGTGTHTIQGSAGTLQINAFTLGGAITGNSQNITGLGNLSLADTKTIALGGVTSAAYQAIANSGGTPTNPNVTADNDLYVQGDLDIGGTVYAGGVLLANYWTRTAGSLSPATLNDTISATTSASTALTITQTGAFDVVRFEDQASDTSPFLIDQAGNVGIGSTAPTQKLDVVGSIALQNSNTVTGVSNFTQFSSGVSVGGGTTYYINGSGAGVFSGLTSPSLTNAGTLALSATGANVITLSTNSTERWRVDSAGVLQANGAQTIQTSTGDLTLKSAGGNGNIILTPNGTGNVGIGTTLPGKTLAVNGTISGTQLYDYDNVAYFLDPAATSTSLTVAGSVGIGTSSPIGLLNVSGAYTGKALAIFNQTGDQDILTASSSGTTKFVISNAGNIGIGTTSPAGLVHLYANQSSLSVLRIQNTATGATTGTYEDFYNNDATARFGVGVNSTGHTDASAGFVWMYSAQALKFGTDNTERLRILSGGNIGIGTSAPIGLLNISGKATGKALFNINETGNQDVFTASVSGSTKFVIANTGNVGIGYTSPTNVLDVNGSIGFSSDVYNTDSGVATWIQQNGGDWRLNMDAATGTGTQAFRVFSTGTAVFGTSTTAPTDTVDINGNLQVDLAGGTATFGICHATNGAVANQQVRDCSSAPTDIAEFYASTSDVEPGDLLTLVETGNSAVPFRAVKTTNAYDQKVIGVVSTTPTGPNGKPLGEKTIADSEYPTALGISGRVPVKVSLENGPISQGDWLTSSSVPGVAMKATKSSFVIGRAIESYDGSIQVSSGTRNQEEKRRESNIPFNKDPRDPQAGVGKILMVTHATYFSPEVQLADSGDLNITGNDAASFEAWAGQYKFENKGGFSDAIIARLTAGLTKTQQLIVNGTATFVGTIQASTINASSIAVNSLSIAGQSLHDYIIAVVQQAGFTNNTAINSPVATIDQLNTNVISPLGNNEVTINGDVKIEKTASRSGNLSIAGNASISGTLSAQDASIAGTLRANKIIADDIEGLNARIASIAANQLTASSAAVTNIYNNYTIATQSAIAASPSGNASSSAPLVPGDAYSLITSSLYSDVADISSLSASLAYLPTLTTDLATINQGLMVFGSTSLSDTAIAGQLSVNGSLILADNSINVLGSTFEIQPLRQGNVSFMGGLIAIDTDGNLSVSGNATFAKDVAIGGKLTARVVSPIPQEDLVIQLPGGAYDQGTLAVDRPGITVKNGSGSAVLKITDVGDVIASGAGKFAEIAADSLKVVRGAQADTSSLETVASASAGTATIKAGRYERTILSPFVTEKSLIYITPVSDTGGATPFVARQVAEDQTENIKGSFTIRIPQLQSSDIKVNWWIIN